MALVLATTDKDLTRRRKNLTISATPSGDYVVGGDTADLTAVTNPKGISNGKVAALPKTAKVVNSPGGYVGEFIIGATLATCKLKVYTAMGVELTAIAYNATLLADPFLIELSGPLGNF